MTSYKKFEDEQEIEDETKFFVEQEIEKIKQEIKQKIKDDEKFRQIKDEIEIENKLKILKENIKKMKLDNYTIEQIQKGKLEELEREEQNLYFAKKYIPFRILLHKLQEEEYENKDNKTINEKKRYELYKLMDKINDERWKKEELKRTEERFIFSFSRLRNSMFYGGPDVKNDFIKALPIIERNVKILQNNSDISRSEFEKRYSLLATLNNLISDEIANGDLTTKKN
jgi:small-conductance mechanosensitive channel